MSSVQGCHSIIFRLPSHWNNTALHKLIKTKFGCFAVCHKDFIFMNFYSFSNPNYVWVTNSWASSSSTQLGFLALSCSGLELFQSSMLTNERRKTLFSTSITPIPQSKLTLTSSTDFSDGPRTWILISCFTSSAIHWDAECVILFSISVVTDSQIFRFPRTICLVLLQQLPS